MSVTITLQNSMNFVKPILKNQPLMATGQEPALTMANIILQRMLSPPFRWRFNRNTFTFETVVTTPPTTDYELALPDFGFMEDQWTTDADGNTKQLGGKVSLGVDTSLTRPTQMAPQFETDTGYVVFRLANSPDDVYTVNGVYQMKPPVLASPASTWSPVTDEFGYIYNMGFLTLMSLLVNDARFPIFEKWFVAALLGAQDGLTDQERSIFFGSWAAATGGVARAQSSQQMGSASRGQ